MIGPIRLRMDCQEGAEPTMLAAIELENFKSYRKAKLALRPITVLVGPNNAGKSTILQAILLLKQTFEDKDPTEPLITSGPFLDLGSYHDILRQGREASDQRLSIGLSIPSDFADAHAPTSIDEPDQRWVIATDLKTTFGFDPEANRIEVHATKVAQGTAIPRTRRTVWP